jgi:hypothetical protein
MNGLAGAVASGTVRTMGEERYAAPTITDLGTLTELTASAGGLASVVLGGNVPLAQLSVPVIPGPGGGGGNPVVPPVITPVDDRSGGQQIAGNQQSGGGSTTTPPSTGQTPATSDYGDGGSGADDDGGDAGGGGGDQGEVATSP